MYSVLLEILSLLEDFLKHLILSVRRIFLLGESQDYSHLHACLDILTLVPVDKLTFVVNNALNLQSHTFELLFGEVAGESIFFSHSLQNIIECLHFNIRNAIRQL